MASLLNNTGVWFIYYLSTIELEKKDFFIYRNKYYYLTQKDKYYLLLIKVYFSYRKIWSKFDSIESKKPINYTYIKANFDQVFQRVYFN